MGALEKFLHDDPVRTPILTKAALAHVQFETIHPFLDGNGRLGRLLITFLLCAEGVPSQPFLYLSLYFKAHRDRYYELLQKVRQTGDCEEWLAFFLKGVAFTAQQASTTARGILDLFQRDQEKLSGLRRSSGSAIRLHQYMQRNPVLSIPKAAKALGTSQPTVTSALANLTNLGIVREVTGKRRDRLFVYDGYLALLNEGTEPISK